MVYKNNLYFDVQSASHKVTGNCTYLTIPFPNKTEKRILIDVGLFQEKEYLELNKSFGFKPENIDYVFITHNHTDHTGRIPLLYKLGYKHMVFCTNKTHKVLPIALNDTTSILYSDAKLKKEKPLYNLADTQKALNSIISYPNNELFRLDDNISFMFIPNAHIYGAASIFLKIKYPGEKTINLLFSGDYAKENMLFNTEEIPSWIFDTSPIIFQECTYGNTNSWDTVHVFKENMVEACKEEKCILLPAFSLGRYQEAMYLINLYKKMGVIPKNYPVYLDGVMPLKYNSIILNDDTLKKEAKEILNAYPFTIVTHENRGHVMQPFGKKIVIASSGMMTNGWSYEYMKNWLCYDNVLIHLLGYMAEGTFGRKLLEIKKGDILELLDGQKVLKLAQVEHTSELSAHAKQDDLLEYLKPFPTINAHFSMHGDNDVREIYSSKVATKINPKSTFNLRPDTIYRLDGYGFRKSIPLTNYAIVR